MWVDVNVPRVHVINTIQPLDMVVGHRFDNVDLCNSVVIECDTWIHSNLESKSSLLESWKTWAWELESCALRCPCDDFPYMLKFKTHWYIFKGMNFWCKLCISVSMCGKNTRHLTLSNSVHLFEYLSSFLNANNHSFHNAKVVLGICNSLRENASGVSTVENVN